MRTIDADKAIEEFCGYCTLDPKKCGGDCSFIRFIERQPTVVALPAARCRECMFYKACEVDGEEMEAGSCEYMPNVVVPDDGWCFLACKV